MRKIMFHLNCLEQGGAERVVSNLANYLAAEYDDDFEIIVATEWQGDNEFTLNERVHRLHVGLRPDDEKKGRLTQAVKRVLYLRRAIKREAPDLVIAFARKANYRTLMAAAGIKTPVIISIRTDPTGHYDCLADKLQIPILFPRAAGCVFQTEGQRDFFPERVRKHSRIILNPIHAKYIGLPRPPVRQKTVVQTGRLVDFKNQPLLIEAFVKVHQIHPEYVLKIYGGDSFDGTKERLEKLIDKHQAGSYVQLMGASDRLEMEIWDAGLFAFTSDWEGLPNTLLEAMALGLPIVATDCPCGGPRTVISDGENGLLIPIKDEGALVKGMCRLIEDPRLAEALGEQAVKIGQSLSPEAVTRQWLDYITQVINNY